MKNSYHACIRAISYLEWIMKDPGKLNKDNKDWLMIRHHRETKMLAQLSLDFQYALEIRIAALKHEIAMHQQVLG